MGSIILTNLIPCPILPPPPPRQGCFMPSLVEIGPVVLGKKFFLILSMYFHYFIIISPWKRAWPFIWTNLNPLHPGILCAKFGWNWPSGSGEEDKNVKSLQTDRQTDRQTDDGRQVIRKAHLSFQLRWAKKNIDLWCYWERSCNFSIVIKLN